MRVNIYAEEITQRIQIISKTIEGQTFTGLRFYLELPVTLNPTGVTMNKQKPDNVSGPFLHTGPMDDDSSAVTFWGKTDLREAMGRALDALDVYYGNEPRSQREGKYHEALCECRDIAKSYGDYPTGFRRIVKLIEGVIPLTATPPGGSS